MSQAKTAQSGHVSGSESVILVWLPTTEDVQVSTLMILLPLKTFTYTGTCVDLLDLLKTSSIRPIFFFKVYELAERDIGV